MSQSPRRMIFDPEFAAAFEGLAKEQGRIEALPDDVRADVAKMIATSIAGAAGVAAGVAASTALSGGSSAVGAAATGVSGSASVLSGGAAVSSMAGASTAAGSATAGGVALGGATLGSVGTTAAVTGGVATASGGMSVISASVAALGVVPKVLAAVSLVGAVATGGVVVAREVAGPERTAASSYEISGPEKASVDAALAKTSGAARRPGRLDEAEDGARGSDVVAPASDETQNDIVPVEGSSSSEEGALQEEDETKAQRDVKVPAPAQGPSRKTKGLAGEVRLLQKARAALGVSRERAWVYLNEYRRVYPEGALRSEYETLVQRAQAEPDAGALTQRPPSQEK